jgi:hypothetical protein
MDAQTNKINPMVIYGVTPFVLSNLQCNSAIPMLCCFACSDAHVLCAEEREQHISLSPIQYVDVQGTPRMDFRVHSIMQGSKKDHHSIETPAL